MKIMILWCLVTVLVAIGIAQPVMAVEEDDAPITRQYDLGAPPPPKPKAHKVSLGMMM